MHRNIANNKGFFPGIPTIAILRYLKQSPISVTMSTHMVQVSSLLVEVAEVSVNINEAKISRLNMDFIFGIWW